MLLAPRYWGAHLLMVLAVAASVALGLWQYDAWGAGRAAEARDLSQVRPRGRSTEVMGGDDPFPGEDLGRPVSLRGEWLGAGNALRRRSAARRQARLLGGDTGAGRARARCPSYAAGRRSRTHPSRAVRWRSRAGCRPPRGPARSDDDPQDDVIPEMRIASIVEHVDADLYSAYVVAEATHPGADQDLAPVTPESVPEVSERRRTCATCSTPSSGGSSAGSRSTSGCAGAATRSRQSRAGTVEEEQVASSL